MIDRSQTAVDQPFVAPVRKRRIWIGLVLLALIFCPLVWVTNWFSQRTRLFNLALRIDLRTPKLPWIESVFGHADARIFGEPETLDFPPDVRLSPSQVRMIGRFKQLRGLIVAGLSDADLRQLRNLANLEYLIISDSPITDAGMSVIGNFKKLTTLQIDVTETGMIASRVSDVGLRQIVNLPLLDRLRVVSGLLTDDALKTVGQLSALRDARITSPLIHGDGLRHLSGLNLLSALSLPGCPLDDLGCLSHLASNSRLQFLELQHTSITDERLDEILPLTNLKVVNLLGAAVSQEGCQLLKSQRPKLGVIGPQGDFVDDPDIR